MDKIIITLRDGTKRISSYDLEVPTDVPISQLKKDIAATLNAYKNRRVLPDANVSLFSANLNRALKDDETLESAGVWNGDYIDFILFSD